LLDGFTPSLTLGDKAQRLLCQSYLVMERLQNDYKPAKNAWLFCSKNG